MDLPLPRRKITRHREFRACTECRRRKLKCDRQSPCNSCVRRNDAPSCLYERAHGGNQNERGQDSDAESRLNHLEQLVKQLFEGQSMSDNLGSLTGVQGSGPFSNFDVSSTAPNESIYNGPTHWSAILEDIAMLRSVVAESGYSDDLDSSVQRTEMDGFDVVFGNAEPLSFDDILARFLPPKRESDRLVALYLRTKSVAAPLIHTGHFRRLYQQFWNGPSNAPPLWASFLFSILDIAARTMSGSNVNLDVENSNTNYSLAAAYCLVAGQYHQPKRFAVEALILFIQARCITTSDLHPDIQIIFGTLIRLATVSGYHRDPDNSPFKYSPFEGEMRRRAWSLCMQLDLLVSFQLGLPSVIQYPTWDARQPTNLLDTDFDEDTATLPTGRPLLEPTRLQFYIVKHQFMAVFEKILRHSLSTTDASEEEIDSLDREVRETRSNLPDIFLPRPIADSIVDAPIVVVARLCANEIYQKCLCALHRRHASNGRAHSIQVCYEAASDIIARHVDAYREFLPGGQLESERWFLGSLTWHDFLLGCACLCLVLCVTSQSAIGSLEGITIDPARSLDLLSKAAVVCEDRSDKSRDTWKVRRFIHNTIAIFGGGISGQPSGSILIPPGFQENAQNMESNTFDPPAQPFAGDTYLPWGDIEESQGRQGADPTWAYLEQFLNLPDDEAPSKG